MLCLQSNQYYPEHYEVPWCIQSYSEWRKKTTNNPYGRLRDLRQMLIQLIFQSVRGAELEDKWKLWIRCASTMQSLKTLLSYGYASCAMIRDVSFGRGERLLAYKQLWAFYEVIAEQSIEQAEQLVRFMVIRWISHGKTDHPYGSWQDARDMCAFIYGKTGNRRHPLIIDFLKLMIQTTARDVVKWYPREHTSLIYDTFVEEWYKHHGYTMMTGKLSCDLRTLTRSQQTHCRRRVRKDVQQIRRTHKIPHTLRTSWFSVADPAKQPFIIHPHMLNLHHQRLYPGHLVQRVRQWIELKQSPMRWHSWSLHYLKKVIDRLWCEMEDMLDVSLSNEVPYVDVSVHMSDEQLNHAIGLALLCGRESGTITLVGDVSRIVKVEGTSAYQQIVDILLDLPKVRGTHFNIYNAIRSHIGKRIVIFSAFQCPYDERQLPIIRATDTRPCLFESLQKLTTTNQEEQGIVFWNMTPTDGFPTQAVEMRCYMLSGYSPYELKIPSMVMGIELSRVHMPYSHLLMRLNSYRYEVFVSFISKLFDN